MKVIVCVDTLHANTRTSLRRQTRVPDEILCASVVAVPRDILNVAVVDKQQQERHGFLATPLTAIQRERRGHRPWTLIILIRPDATLPHTFVADVIEAIVRNKAGPVALSGFKMEDKQAAGATKQAAGAEQQAIAVTGTDTRITRPSSTGAMAFCPKHLTGTWMHTTKAQSPAEADAFLDHAIQKPFFCPKLPYAVRTPPMEEWSVTGPPAIAPTGASGAAAIEDPEDNLRFFVGLPDESTSTNVRNTTQHFGIVCAVAAAAFLAFGIAL